MATQLLLCAQGNCDQTDLQSFIEWAQEACAGVGVSFDASTSSIIATKASTSSLATSTAQNQAIMSLTTSSQASVDASSKATMTSSDNGSALSGGLATSDKIAIGIGVPVGVATILTLWLTWKMLLKKKKKGQN